MEVCNYALDVAQEEAKKRMWPQYQQMTCDLADEIIATAKEYVTEADNQRA